MLFSFGAPAAGGSLFGNNNAAAKPLFGQTAGTSFGATNTFGTPGASSFGATGFGGAQMGGGGFGAAQPQAQAQGQQGQGKIDFQDLLQVKFSTFYQNKPERVFGLQVRRRESNTFKILELF